MKKLVSIAAVVALASMLATTTADAAKPSRGALGYSRRTLKWTGGPYDTTQSYPVTSIDWCLGGRTDSMCDHYLFKVNMGNGARIKVTIKGSTSGFEAVQQANANAIAPNDFDLAVYDPAGRQVGSVGNNTSNESLTFTHKAKWRNKYYEVRVVPFLLVPGAYYRGTIQTVKYVK